MSLVHSNENIPSSVDEINTQKCFVCKKDYEIDDIVVSTPCYHIYHKECIVSVLKETQACPMCGKSCRQTKLKSHNILAENEKQTTNTPSQINNNLNLNQNQGAIPKAITHNKKVRRNLLDNNITQTPIVNREDSQIRSLNNLFNNSQNNSNSRSMLQNIDSHSISDSALQLIINEAVRNQLASMNLNSNRPCIVNPISASQDSQNRRNHHTNDFRPSFGNRNYNQNRNFPNRPNSRLPTFNHNFDLTTDKVSNIMSGWHLKFSGQDEEELSVDNFLYRVQALTIQSLRGDFEVLCRHIHLLFSGKAMDWFWRFHRTSSSFDWETLCVQLKNQFRDRRTDFDLKEQIRGRKQRMGEKFDDYYDTILQIADRLENPITQFELIEILKRNLRPEIRKGLLHFKIESISQLREFVRKHEILEEELEGRRSNRSFNSRRTVSEIETDNVEIQSVQVEEISDIICWNCSEKGHRFDDCLGERRIFCYGCGAPNIFKPNCGKCNKFSKNCQANKHQRQFQSKATQM